jgi:hypothetical protein
MSWRDWFGIVAVEGLTGEQETFLDELGQMLDLYRPTKVDRAHSGVRSHEHGWTMDEAVEVRLAHSEQPDVVVEAVIGLGEALLAWLTAHEHLSAADDEPGGRRWTTRLVDAIAGVLGGDFEVVDTYRGKRLVRTRIIDVAHPDGPRTVGETGSLLRWLPGPGRARTESRRVDFGVQVPA